MNKGFTLIELLAVIILLILLIGVGVFSVNKILLSSRKELSDNQKRNLEKIAETYNIAEGIDDDAYCVSVSDLLKKGYIEGTSVIDPKNKDELTGSIRIKYVNNKYKYTYQDKECSPCELVSGNEKEIGSKYECEVKKGTIYDFYVLSYNDEDNNTIYDKSKSVTTNLIMDRNICDNGTPATEDNTCHVKWISEEDYGCKVEGDSCATNEKGPVTAMTYLYNATKSWTNISPLNYEYYDREWQKSKDVIFEDGSGYTSFTSVNGEGKINGKKFTEEKPLRARMPIYAYNSDIGTGYGEVGGYYGSNVFLYENLDSSTWNYREVPTNSIKNIYGYWTLSSYSLDSSTVLFVNYNGKMNDGDFVDVLHEYDRGVRPVINVKL